VKEGRRMKGVRTKYDASGRHDEAMKENKAADMNTKTGS